MMDRWVLQEAKNRLSYVVEQAVTSGPQTITVRGQPKVVVLATEEYERLTKPATSLADFFLDSPLHGSGIDLERGKSYSRISASSKE